MAAPTKTRAERIEEYVLRDAWSTVLYDAHIATSSLEIDNSGEIASDAAGEMLGPIERELWPEALDGDGSPEGDLEYEAASTRGMILASAILAQLTTREAQNFLVSEAARLAKLADDRGKAADV